jgi:hypothetical protein
MKTFFITLSLLFALSVNTAAQKEKVYRYQTLIYTNDKIDVLIQKEYEKRGDGTRSFVSGLATASYDAGKGIAGGYVTSFIDIGVTAIASLLTKNANNKLKWEEVVKAENTYQETLSTVEAINDFYSQPSLNGPLDPEGMNFSGIGCLRKIDNDTVFYVSCHIDQSKIKRIINHSKFELVLDTLIINPYRCNLPNSSFDTLFSFDRRNNLQITVEMRLISSWINIASQLYKEQELGCFNVNISVNKSDLNEKGEIRFVRTEDKPAKYKITGESFIVPRSLAGYRNNDKEYKNMWGTGDYKVEIKLKENCGITDAFRKEWKSDWKRRQNAQKGENIVKKSWKLISSQKWDEISKQWVITTLKAPAAIINDDLLDELGLQTSSEAN